MPETPHQQPLAELERRAQEELAGAVDEESLRSWHSRYLGDKGEVKLAIKKVGNIPPSDRRDYGQAVNRIKEALTAAYDTASARAKERELQQSLTAQALDITL